MNRTFSFFNTASVMRSRGPTCLPLPPPAGGTSCPLENASDGSETWIQTRRERLRAAETSVVKSLRPLAGGRWRRGARSGLRQRVWPVGVEGTRVGRTRSSARKPSRCGRRGEGRLRPTGAVRRCCSAGAAGQRSGSRQLRDETAGAGVSAPGGPCRAARRKRERDGPTMTAQSVMVSTGPTMLGTIDPRMRCESKR